MSWLSEVLGSPKPVIAMAHLPPLPGAPLYDAEGGMAAIVDYVGRDLEALQAAGVDCIMFGNEGDRPYLLEASPESLAAMTAVVAELKGGLRVPFGGRLHRGPNLTSVGRRFAHRCICGFRDFRDHGVCCFTTVLGRGSDVRCGDGWRRFRFRRCRR